MITLYDVYEEGSDAVKDAVLAFGARHPSIGGADAEPDWKTAEKHFTQVIETIMGSASPLSPGSTDGAVRRAENAAIGFLLAIATRSDFRCPICVKRRQRPSL
ncbi:hypothetical protein ACFFKE_08680 [Streptomyces mutabilis]|uniref:hypothetical protein n=1 Tax=Streptomyces mutabilis TaxID=67332 RepID=UPI00177BA119|nr:hypothetical protein [Streptomyces mutabilis]MCZ9354766.1 hypothetical protein [Streptomyces mutabilis]GGQ49839.1 hypothetical protein GCM10010279_69020 [Streptomyces mutabilis]